MNARLFLYVISKREARDLVRWVGFLALRFEMTKQYRSSASVRNYVPCEGSNSEIISGFSLQEADISVFFVLFHSINLYLYMG